MPSPESGLRRTCDAAIPTDTVRAALAARRTGALVVLNAAPSGRLPDDIWSQVDVLVVNEAEAVDLVGLTEGADLLPAGNEEAAPEALASSLLALVPAVVVALGGAGSLVVERSGSPVRTPAVEVHAVDTTGAGDTYCGVLAAALSRGATLPDATLSAGAAGALAVTRRGAQDAVPTAAEVETLATGRHVRP
ncbi:PfkB family carbohydrate kinase [Myceligenerans indicum]|uniref:Carbohydrate kinase PfkB domain-containing protein n=1 Tax=Myceligenerans indicum TaxID=2593663 RepID=A0ABS1LR50_9MICO|nr:PfkB family carbohydrate kinase [Myceligenerans indicum]MBL0888762.1 hypothetical protein [Myceligenerans indicum]